MKFSLFVVSESGSDLKICKLSQTSCGVDGGEEVMLLCEKVNKGTYYTYS